MHDTLVTGNEPRSAEATPEFSTSTARREGEKRSKMPLTSASALVSGEVSSHSALAHSPLNAASPPHPDTTGKNSEVASADPGTDREADVSGPKDIIRATCKIKIDLADLCVTADERSLHIKRKCGGPVSCAACSAQAVFRSTRRECARVANASMRMRSLMDGLLVDRYQFQHGRAPKGAEWKEASQFAGVAIQAVAGHLPIAERSALESDCLRKENAFYAYPILTRIAPSLAAGITSAVDKSVNDKWRTDRWNALVSLEKSPPHYRYTNPIPLRKADVSLTKTTDDRFLLSFSMRSHSARGAGLAEGVTVERKKEFSLPLIARDEYMRSALSLVTADNTRLGEVKITEDRKRPGRWYARIAYKRAVEQKTGGKAAAINKGMVTFLAGVTETGEQWIHDGDDIAAFLAQIQARRQRYQRQVKSSARIGHGRGRTLRPIEHLSGKAERWRETRCQVIARRFVDWLVKEGVTRLYIDDFSGIRDTPPEDLEKGQWIWERIQEWPYYQLEMRIGSCCEEMGIETIRRSPNGISVVCSYCASKSVRIKNRKMYCRDCRKFRHMDVSAAAVNLQLGERERSGEKLPGAQDLSGKRGGSKTKKGGARKPPLK